MLCVPLQDTSYRLENERQVSLSGVVSFDTSVAISTTVSVHVPHFDRFSAFANFSND